MATYTIKAIKFCEQTVPGPQMFFMSRWDEWMVADFLFFILRRDDGQVMLIDTGVRDVDEIQPLVSAGVGAKGRFRMDMETQNIPLLLRKEGIDPGDVAYVFLSHLHYDHCSNVKLFPNARFVVSRTGWHLTLDPPVDGLVPDILFTRGVVAYLAGEARDRLILVDDEAPEIVPGIGAFYVGGHTMCSQAITVQTKQGLGRHPGRHRVLLRESGEEPSHWPGVGHYPMPSGDGTCSGSGRHRGATPRPGFAGALS